MTWQTTNRELYFYFSTFLTRARRRANCSPNYGFPLCLVQLTRAWRCGLRCGEHPAQLYDDIHGCLVSEPYFRCNAEFCAQRRAQINFIWLTGGNKLTDEVIDYFMSAGVPESVHVDVCRRFKAKHIDEIWFFLFLVETLVIPLIEPALILEIEAFSCST